MGSEIIDILAEYIRIAEHGLMRPLWQDLDDAYKRAWRERARLVEAALAARGWTIVNQPEKDED